MGNIEEIDLILKNKRDSLSTSILCKILRILLLKKTGFWVLASDLNIFRDQNFMKIS